MTMTSDTKAKPPIAKDEGGQSTPLAAPLGVSHSAT